MIGCGLAAIALSIVGLTFALLSTNAELRIIECTLKKILSEKEDTKQPDESVEK